MKALKSSSLVAVILAVAGCAAPGSSRLVAGELTRTVGCATVNGAGIYYEIYGSDRAEQVPLVLLHGGGSTVGTSFGSAPPPFARNRQVIAFEQEALGRTDETAQNPSASRQSADDAAALMRNLGIQKADFLGYGNGGSIALQIAIRHPSLVRKLVVASTIFRREGASSLYDEPVKRAAPARMQGGCHVTCAGGVLEDWIAEDLPAIAAPTLVMIADRDMVLPEQAIEILRRIPDARLAVLPGADRRELVKRAEWQLSMVDAFLDGSEPASSVPSVASLD
jgi:pimeloyl-ACP methyl ester carboxylesterase